VPLIEDETTGSLTLKLAEVGAQTLLEVLPLWVAGKITPVPQDEQQASSTRMLSKENGKINWVLPATELARQVRAYMPWPGSYTFWRGKLLKIITAYAVNSDSPLPGVPGTVCLHQEAGHQGLAVVTGAGLLIIKHLQLAGKRTMGTEEFLRGYSQMVGEVLG
jgi:methionyl-tRNA formyltransferase